MQDVRFKAVTTDDELQQIHRLNHRTFAEELGQYEINSSGELVDRYNGLNTYFIAKMGSEVIGMISINSTAPFSIEKRLHDPAVTLAAFAAPSEIRMLAIDPRYRNSIVVAGLFWQVFDEARRKGRTHLLISGITDRAEMYRSLGFRDLGDAVPAGDVSYIPMAMEISDKCVMVKAERFRSWWQRREREAVNLMPGPVEISSGVRRAFARPPISHRSPEMITTYGEVRGILEQMMSGMRVALMTGSGTLANDAVMACLRARFGSSKGLVLANGEFGQRIVRQARMAGLIFEVLEWSWGERWDFAAIEKRLKDVAWVSCVHLETSTGQLNDLARLSVLSEEHGVALAADCVSSLGAVSLDKCRLALASSVSGKALGSYAGLAMVFADEKTLAETDFNCMPATFNIAQNVEQREPMYTVASPQLNALREALRENYEDALLCERRYAHYCALNRRVRQELRRREIVPLVDDESAAPVVCTFALKDPEAAKRCAASGFNIAHESGYLAQRGWAQISVMGDLTWQQVQGAIELL
jgi:aspartate aminotransferase-like enzyme